MSRRRPSPPSLRRNVHTPSGENLDWKDDDIGLAELWSRLEHTQKQHAIITNREGLAQASIRSLETELRQAYDMINWQLQHPSAADQTAYLGASQRIRAGLAQHVAGSEQQQHTKEVDLQLTQMRGQLQDAQVREDQQAVSLAAALAELKQLGSDNNNIDWLCKDLQTQLSDSEAREAQLRQAVLILGEQMSAKEEELRQTVTAMDLSNSARLKLQVLDRQPPPPKIDSDKHGGDTQQCVTAARQIQSQFDLFERSAEGFQTQMQRKLQHTHDRVQHAEGLLALFSERLDAQKAEPERAPPEECFQAAAAAKRELQLTEQVEDLKGQVEALRIERHRARRTAATDAQLSKTGLTEAQKEIAEAQQRLTASTEREECAVEQMDAMREELRLVTAQQLVHLQSVNRPDAGGDAALIAKLRGDILDANVEGQAVRADLEQLQTALESFRTESAKHTSELLQHISELEAALE